MESEHTSEQPQALGPLDRRPDESRVAHDALLAYWEMGRDRSLRWLARLLGKYLSQLAGWSSRYQWQQRVREQEEQERREGARHQREFEEQTRRRREAQAEQLERVAMAGLKSLLVRDPESGEARFDKRLRPADIASLIRVALKMMPTPSAPLVDDEEEVPLGSFSDEDLQRLEELLAKGGTDGKDGPE